MIKLIVVIFKISYLSFQALVYVVMIMEDCSRQIAERLFWGHGHVGPDFLTSFIIIKWGDFQGPLKKKTWIK